MGRRPAYVYDDSGADDFHIVSYSDNNAVYFNYDIT
jgi:hypothetical protein